MPATIFNPNPIVFSPSKSSGRRADPLSLPLWLDDTPDSEDSDETVEIIDEDEIFDLIRLIYDPEHPNTLEELRVVSAPQITVGPNLINVEFTPTVPHCGMSTLIGLSIRVRLLRSLPNRFKVDIRVKPGSHQSEDSLNKQLNDKERVAAALENHALLEEVEKCLSNTNLRSTTI